ncbi:MAG: hypothetical protein AAGL96_08940 [Pseudomonadota bacterium]
MSKPVRIAGVLLLGFVAAVCALIVSAARADFAFRGCPDLPRAEWEATANCADGWFAQLFFGGAALLMAVAAAVLWRWRSG